jgi:hypothetical protein
MCGAPAHVRFTPPIADIGSVTSAMALYLPLNAL